MRYHFNFDLVPGLNVLFTIPTDAFLSGIQLSPIESTSPPARVQIEHRLMRFWRRLRPAREPSAMMRMEIRRFDDSLLVYCVWHADQGYRWAASDGCSIRGPVVAHVIGERAGTVWCSAYVFNPFSKD